MQVQELTLCIQNLKTMSTPFRDDKHTANAATQFFGMPLQKCSGARAKVDGYIPNFAFQAQDEFHFGVRRPLIMQAAYSACCNCFRPVNLNDVPLADYVPKLFITEQSRKRSAVI